jgi:hypothetical protein
MGQTFDVCFQRLLKKLDSKDQEICHMICRAYYRCIKVLPWRNMSSTTYAASDSVAGRRGGGPGRRTPKPGDDASATGKEQGV